MMKHYRYLFTVMVVCIMAVGAIQMGHAQAAKKNQAGLYTIEKGSTFTMLGQGTVPITGGVDGGIYVGTYQNPPVTETHYGHKVGSDQILNPKKFIWEQVPIYVSTVDADPSNKEIKYPAPKIIQRGKKLQAELSGWTCMWRGNTFNQGSPRSSNDKGPRGTYDPETKAYTLDWHSKIQEGPFEGFTGVWHLVGHFTPGEDKDFDSVTDGNDNCVSRSNPNQEDMDGDGLGDVCDKDADGDGHEKPKDCDDLDAKIHPGAKDICNNNIDEDCSGTTEMCENHDVSVGEVVAPKKALRCKDRKKSVSAFVYNKGNVADKVKVRLTRNDEEFEVKEVLIRPESETKVVFRAGYKDQKKDSEWCMEVSIEGKDEQPDDNVACTTTRIRDCK